MRSLRKYRVILIFVVIFAAIGVTLLITSHAATPYTSNEGESGTLASGATIQSDTNASGGKYIQFGAPAAPPTQPPASGNPAAAAIGFYPCDCADRVGALTSEASMLGRSIQSVHVTLMSDNRSPSLMSGNGWGYFVGNGTSANPTQWQAVNPHANLTISLPLAFGGFSPNQATGSAGLTSVASGADDGDYTAMVNYAKNAGYNNITWRVGWEFDGDWMPWSSRNNPAEFVAAYRHIHDLVKGLMPGSKFDWCGDIGQTDWQNQWAAAYPGDAYVDIIGADNYDSANVGSAAGYNNIYGPFVRFQRDFAIAHGKQISYPEWGLFAGDDPGFIQGMHDWINTLPASGPGSIAYADYFNATTNGAKAITDPSVPNSKAKLIQLFSK